MTDLLNKLIIENICEQYVCIQGEGKYIGTPSILIRFNSCPLNCVYCDTPIVKDHEEINLDNLTELYKNNPHITHTIITGGSPYGNGTLLKMLIDYIHDVFNHYITVETAGVAYVETAADFISLSPKLDNSDPSNEKIKNIHRYLRQNYKVMSQLIHNHDYQIKFVVDRVNLGKSIQEIHGVCEKIGGVDYSKVYLMPKGATKEELELNRKVVFEFCIETGLNYTDRLSVLIYDKKRGV